MGIFNKVKEFSGQIAVYGLGDALYKVISFVLLPLYLKHLNPAQYGTLETLNVTQGIALTFIAMGLPNAVFRFYYRVKDKAERKAIVSTIFFLSLIAQIFLSLLFFINNEILSKLIFNSPEFAFLFAILSVNIFLASFRRIPMAIYRAQKRAWMHVTINLTVALVTLLANIYFVALLNKGILGVILGNLCGALVGVALVFPAMIREVGIIFGPSIVKKILVFSVPLGLAQLPFSIILMADRFFLVKFTSLRDLGIYALAYKFGLLIKEFLSLPVGLAWAPFLFSNEQQENAREIYSKIAIYFVIIGTAIVVLISVFSIDVIKLLTNRSEYNEASNLVPVLCYAFFLFGLSHIVWSGIHISGKTYYSTIIMTICLCFNLLSNYVLIRAYGYKGAAYALLFTFILINILSYIVSSRLYYINYKIGKILHIVFISVVAIVLSQLSIPNYILDNIYNIFAQRSAFNGMENFILWLSDQSAFFHKENHGLMFRIIIVMLFFAYQWYILFSKWERQKVLNFIVTKVVSRAA